MSSNISSPSVWNASGLGQFVDIVIHKEENHASRQRQGVENLFHGPFSREAPYFVPNTELEFRDRAREIELNLVNKNNENARRRRS